MKNLKKNNNNRGFTLIEVLVAITVFAIGLMAVISMQLTAVKGNSYSRRMTEGSNLALGKLEELAGLPYSDTNLTAGSHAEAQNGYALTWTVTNNKPLSTSKQIVVNVQWNERGMNKQVTLTGFKPDII